LSLKAAKFEDEVPFTSTLWQGDDLVGEIFGGISLQLSDPSDITRAVSPPISLLSFH
jgi:hypothetical protein